MDQNKSVFSPEKLASELHLQKGERVAELGCGSGHMVVAIARKVGEEGKVYAIDILDKKLEAVRSSAKLFFLNNIVTIKGNLESKGSLGEALNGVKVEKAIIANVLFANSKKEDIISEAASILPAGGTLVIVDWQKTDIPFAPPKELLVDHGEITRLCSKLGLSFKSDLKIGDSHWGKTYVKK